jgi:hypothetical protein
VLSTSDWRRPTATATSTATATPRRPHVSGASPAKATDDKNVASLAAHDKAGEAPVTAFLVAKTGDDKADGALEDAKTADD